MMKLSLSAFPQNKAFTVHNKVVQEVLKNAWILLGKFFLNSIMYTGVFFLHYTTGMENIFDLKSLGRESERHLCILK